MPIRRSESSCNDKTQRKRPACENFTDERSYKYTKTANNLDLNPPKPIKGPLSRQALKDLNKLNQSSSSKSSYMSPNSDEPSAAINANVSRYSATLTYKGIYFAHAEQSDKDPSNIKELMRAVSAPRFSYTGPNDNDARDLRIIMRKASNESELVLSVLPQVIPLAELQLDNDISTAPEELWHRDTMIGPTEIPMLPTLKPNRTIGWSKHIFKKFPHARQCLDEVMCPRKVSDLTIPLFTIEVKGDNGNLKAARVQNLHNGATMVYNLWRIREYCLGNETDDFFNRVHAMSLELTADIVQLSCYWAVRDEDGKISYYGRATHIWTLWDGSHFKQAHHYTRNALEWVRKQALEWLCPALSALEEKINTGSVLPRTPHASPIQASPNQASPDRAYPDRGGGKRPRSAASESSSASHSPIKKKGASKTRRGGRGRRGRQRGAGRGGGRGEAGDDEVSEFEAGPLSRNFRKCTCGGEW